MASLVPPFNCPSPHQSLQAKPRALVNIRVQCISYQMTAVIDFEKIQLPTLESHVKSFSNSSSSSYVRAISLPTKGIQTDFELLISGEEETIAAAAAEAIALAKAALDVAKHAAQMKGSDSFVRAKKIEDASSEFDQVLIERVRLSELESQTNIIKEQDEEDDEDEDDKALESTSITKDEEIDSERIIVRSNRQSERRDRRSRIATKDANNVISVKSGSTGRKKKASLQEVDYSDPLRYLRATTSSTKLLTVSEELELSEGIQEMIKLEKLQEELTERFGSPPSFAQWAAAAKVDQKTLRKRLNYGKHCKDRMIKSNIRLVISIAKNFQGAGMNLQDLVQEGCRGLVKGAEKFDASKGFKFSTYAHWWIKQAVRRSLSEQSRTIRLPFHMVEATYRVREARKQLYSENGKYPDNEELAKEAGLTMKRFTAVMLAPKAPRSLDQKYGIDMSLKPSEVIADPEALTSEEILIKQIVRRDLNKVLDSLSPREKQVIKWRFGLGDGRMKTLQEIGEAIGVSRERIRQIESCAFRKLKNKKRTKNLRQHLIT